jgi:hypothetical protein
MKTILFLTFLASGFMAKAQESNNTVVSKTTVISEREVVIPAEIRAGNVKLSRADYAMPVVKILVPALADVTALDHRNLGEGAPCLAALDNLNPEDIIQANPQTENITLTIKLAKTATPHTDLSACDMMLTESIEGLIRGHRFVHERFLALPARSIDDCR